MTYQPEMGLKKADNMFFDILEIKSYGMLKRLYVIEYQWFKPEGGLPAIIHEKKD